jgi:hypothetical protein
MPHASAACTLGWLVLGVHTLQAHLDCRGCLITPDMLIQDEGKDRRNVCALVISFMLVPGPWRAPAARAVQLLRELLLLFLPENQQAGTNSGTIHTHNDADAAADAADDASMGCLSCARLDCGQ